jgi:RHS repeat-associated protein
MNSRGGWQTALALLASLWAPDGWGVNSGKVEYYHHDALGNVRVVTDETGQVIERHDYLPFGEECTTGACAANLGVGTGQPRKFTGKPRDAETGLDYFGARYYGQRVGRFTTIDPVYTWNENLHDPQRWNRYAYGRNNPLRYVDPDGRVPVLAGAATVAAVAWGAYEVGSQIYDAYTVYQTVTSATATTGEKAAAVGGFAIGAVAPGGGYGVAARAAVSKADDAFDVARAITRTPTDRLIQHTTRDDLMGAAREVATGAAHGGQHLKEVRDAARGLRARIEDIQQGLSNPRLGREQREALQTELGLASRNLDAAKQALQGEYRRHVDKR